MVKFVLYTKKVFKNKNVSNEPLGYGSSVVEHLPHKEKVLSSNTDTVKKKSNTMSFYFYTLFSVFPRFMSMPYLLNNIITHFLNSGINLEASNCQAGWEYSSVVERLLACSRPWVQSPLPPNKKNPC